MRVLQIYGRHFARITGKRQILSGTKTEDCSALWGADLLATLQLRQLDRMEGKVEAFYVLA